MSGLKSVLTAVSKKYPPKLQDDVYNFIQSHIQFRKIYIIYEKTNLLIITLLSSIIGKLFNAFPMPDEASNEKAHPGRVNIRNEIANKKQIINLL